MLVDVKKKKKTHYGRLIDQCWCSMSIYLCNLTIFSVPLLCRDFNGLNNSHSRVGLDYIPIVRGELCLDWIRIGIMPISDQI